MKTTIGKCGKCGGAVQKDKIWMGVQEQAGKCSSCGAHEDKLANMPVLPMINNTKQGE